MGNALPLQGHLHMMLWSPGIQHQREAAFCLLPTQQSGKNARLKGEREAKSLLKDVSTAHGHHYWQNPKATASASICSVSSSPTVIYSS